MKVTWKKTLASWWEKDNRRRVLVAVGLVGIALLAVPSLLPSRGDKESATTEPVLTADAVEQALEQRLTALVSQVEGVGDCRVMVTLERGAQQVYAADTSSTTTDDTAAHEESILTVDTADGPVGLPVTTLQPAVRGVAVVCSGGGDERVCQQVTALVSTALHISDRRVCVAKLK